MTHGMGVAADVMAEGVTEAILSPNPQKAAGTDGRSFLVRHKMLGTVLPAVNWLSSVRQDRPNPETRETGFQPPKGVQANLVAADQGC